MAQTDSQRASLTLLKPPLATVIISNYNYGRYLGDAIDSVLLQTYSRTELVVVDDGSTDDSKLVISRYGSTLKPVLKDNGGQASAWNAGLACSSGEVIIFLDSDDLLLPIAVEKCVDMLSDRSVGFVHWTPQVVFSDGALATYSSRVFPDGDLHRTVAERGPYGTGWQPLTSNAFRRELLQRIMPMPEAPYQIGADLYLCALMPLYGTVAHIYEPLSQYRYHSDNNSWRRPFPDRLSEAVVRDRYTCEVLVSHCRSLGIPCDPTQWEPHLWWPQTARTIDEIDQIIPAGKPFLLAGGDAWGAGPEICGRAWRPFTEHGGLPSSNVDAIAELERERTRGAMHLVIAWPNLWWLDWFPEFIEHLNSRYTKLRGTERVVAYDLEDDKLSQNHRSGMG